MSLKIRVNKRLFEGEVPTVDNNATATDNTTTTQPQDNTDAALQDTNTLVLQTSDTSTAQQAEQDENLVKLNEHTVAFFDGLITALKQQCSGENILKVIPYIKTANDDNNNPYNLNAKTLSEQVKAFANVAQLKTFDDITTSFGVFNSVTQGILDFVKTVNDGQQKLADEQKQQAEQTNQTTQAGAQQTAPLA